MQAGRGTILRRGTVRVVVRLSTPGRVRVALFGAPAGDARLRTVTVPKTVTVKGARLVVALPLTGRGRRVFGRCAGLTLRASLTGRRLRRSFTKTFRAPRPCVPASVGDPRAPQNYLVGAAVRDVNPGADGKFAGQNVYLGGYGIGGTRAANGILREGASVRAMTFSDGRNAAALANIEAQGWFAATRDGPHGLIDVRREVERRTGGAIPAARVIVQSDHSHSGIDSMGVWGGAPAAYRRMVLDRTVDAIVAAFEGSAPARLRYGAVDGRDLLSNQFDYDAANREVDREVRVLQARDLRNRPLVTLLNFSAHTTVLGSGNRKVSGDWVQAANPLLERRLGGRAVTVVGTLGRTQPADRQCPDRSLTGDAQSLCLIDDYAARVVERAVQAAGAAAALPAEPRVAGSTYLVQDAGSSPLLLGLLVAGGPAGIPLNRSLSPPWQAGNVIGTTTGTLRIGDVLLSAVPGEAYPQIAQKVRDLVPARGYMTAGLANDQLGYLIAPYEAYPEPIRRSFFNQRGDEVSPIDNDNYFFNVSHTMGERVTCSLLRGAGEALGRGAGAFRDRYDRCVAFVNDAGQRPGADTR